MNESHVSLDRRSLLKLAGSGLILAVGADGHVARAQAQTADAPRKYGGDAMPGGTVDSPLAFVSIARDGTVTIVAHRVEMGTGIRTSLPMVVADEIRSPHHHHLAVRLRPLGSASNGLQTPTR